jgi:hypothetical protein
MENRGNIRVTEAGCRAGFTQKTNSCRLIADIFFANDLQGHWTQEMNIERLVCYTHRTPTQFVKGAVVAPRNLVMVETAIIGPRPTIAR